MATKDKSAIVSGMGLAMSILQALVEKAHRKGVTDETIHRLATPEGDAILEQFAEVMVRASDLVCRSSPTTRRGTAGCFSRTCRAASSQSAA